MAASFPILIEIDENAPIKTLAALHRLPGIAHIHFDFSVFDKPALKRQKQLLLSGPSSEPNGSANHKSERLPPGFISRLSVKTIAEAGCPLTRTEIKASSKEYGQQMVNSLASLSKRGIIKQVGPATYDLTAQTRRSLNVVEATPAANGHDTKKSDISKNAVGHGKGQAVALGLLEKVSRERGPDFPVTRADLKAAFKNSGLSPFSVGDTMHGLLKAKKIKRPHKGVYFLA